MSTHENVLVYVHRLTASYGSGEEPVLQNISFSLPTHCFALLKGPNGCGKTTLLRCLVGLLAFQGDILIAGQSIRGSSTSELLRGGVGGTRITYAPQGHSVISSLTVRENLLLGGYALRRRERANRVDETIDVFPHLRDLLDVPAGLLSGGQQQQTVLARSIMPQPDLFLIDEPMLGLDSQNQRLVSELLLRIWKQGTSLVVAEHRTEALDADITNVIPMRGK